MILLAAAAVFYGSAVSPGRPVTGSLTFDPAVARQGGKVLAVPRLADGDETAVRMSEALILTNAGAGSRAAREARRRRVPAVALGGARWEPGGRLVLDRVELGPAKNGVRAVESREPLELVEGSVVSVDPERGVVIVPDAADAPAWLAAAEAARAYDGLRDVRSLLLWLEAKPEAGPRLALELLRRAAEGEADPAHFAAVFARVKPDLAALRRELGDARKRFAALVSESRESFEHAASQEAVDRIVAEVSRRREALSRTAEVLGERGETASLSPERRAKLPETADWRAVAEKAGAEARPRVTFGPEHYEAFVQKHRLADQLESAANDASLTLGRKAQRLRALILSKPAPDLPFPPGEALRIVGEGERFDSVPRAEAGKKVLEVWAAAWDPGPLGKRKRDGYLHPKPVVHVEAAGAGAPARAWSRHPLRRGRMLIELAGAEQAPDRRDNEKIPRILRALEGVWGRPVVAELTVDGGRVSVLSAAPDAGSR